MFRFVALTWSVGDGESEIRSSRIHERLLRSNPAWDVSFQSRNTLVLHADARPGSTGAIALARNGGVVLGTLFETRSDARTVRAIQTLDEPESELVVMSRGRHLIENYWGRYVALVQKQASGNCWMLRDPVGALPCYFATHERLQIFFSFAEDVTPLRLIGTTIDWEFIAAHVHRPRFLRCRRTGLHSVQELLPGECLHARPDGTSSVCAYWSPTAIARNEYWDAPQRAARKLHDTTALCVSAWASCYTSITHLLSGGLDSSIVLRCIRDYQPRADVTALTYFNTFSAAADERHFAALITDAARCILVALEEDPAETDLALLTTASASFRPWDVQYYQTHAALERRVTNHAKSQAVFSGSGGDHLYFQGPAALVAGDYVRHRGLDRYALGLCFDIAYAEGLSFWSVLADSLRLRKWSGERNIRRMRLATPDVKLIALRSGLLVPPWLGDAEGISFGKLEHIRMASVPHDFYNPFGPHDAPERVSPLISQPLIELCLRTPLVLLAMGGQDRYLARRAFSSSLPPPIVSRRTKGTADAYVQRLLAHNRRFACEMLLDGMLVSNGYLDRARLERTLLTQEGLVGDAVSEVVVFHLNTECWLRRASVTTSSRS